MAINNMNIEEILKEFDEQFTCVVSSTEVLEKFIVFNERATVKNIKDFIKKAIEQRDKEWLSCMPERMTEKNMSKLSNKFQAETVGEVELWNECRDILLQNLKDKKIID